MKECDNSKIHINSNFILSVSHLIMFDTLLLRPSLHFTTLMTLYLLKMHLQTFLSLQITQKCQILSCDTLVANER